MDRRAHREAVSVRRVELGDGSLTQELTGGHGQGLHHHDDDAGHDDDLGIPGTGGDAGEGARRRDQPILGAEDRTAQVVLVDAGGCRRHVFSSGSLPGLRRVRSADLP